MSSGGGGGVTGEQVWTGSCGREKEGVPSIYVVGEGDVAFWAEVCTHSHSWKPACTTHPYLNILVMTDPCHHARVVVTWGSPPCRQTEWLTDRQTWLKTLPSRKLSVRAVKSVSPIKQHATLCDTIKFPQWNTMCSKMEMLLHPWYSSGFTD